MRKNRKSRKNRARTAPRQRLTESGRLVGSGKRQMEDGVVMGIRLAMAEQEEGVELREVERKAAIVLSEHGFVPVACIRAAQDLHLSDELSDWEVEAEVEAFVSFVVTSLRELVVAGEVSWA